MITGMFARRELDDRIKLTWTVDDRSTDSETTLSLICSGSRYPRLRTRGTEKSKNRTNICDLRFIKSPP